jgi:hypothetical protein
MRIFLILLFFFTFPCGVVFAEKGEPMMAWPMLVQVDWNVYHDKMIENCRIKVPEHSEAFRDGVSKWNQRNMTAILNIRNQLKNRLKSEKGISEAEATVQIGVISTAWTEKFLKLLSSSPESSWQDICVGNKYADESLRLVDFVKFYDSISSHIPIMPMRDLFPKP